MGRRNEKLTEKEKFMILSLSNFVDWFAPNKEVNQRLQKYLKHIARRMENCGVGSGENKSDNEN